MDVDEFEQLRVLLTKFKENMITNINPTIDDVLTLIDQIQATH